MEPDSRRIIRAKHGRRSCKLRKPYKLSFATLYSFDSCWIQLTDNQGGVGVGEAVALPGYSWETADEIEGVLAKLAHAAVGLSPREFEARCAQDRAASPFAASAAMTALELPLLLPAINTRHSFDLNFPVAATDNAAELDRVVAKGLAAGYRHLKLKIGSRLDWDLAAAQQLLTKFQGQHFRVVFDANQAYEPVEALEFARLLEKLASERVAWFEQPLPRTSWGECEKLCDATGTPIVLDESIYDERDILRAAQIGARGVKLKLSKHFGPRNTLALAAFARGLSLEVAFGNGVATDIGNLAEFAVLNAGRGLFAEPSESSGFQKLQEPVLFSGLHVSAGRLACHHAPQEIALRFAQPPATV